jgi:hypothetical protein
MRDGVTRDLAALGEADRRFSNVVFPDPDSPTTAITSLLISTSPTVFT